MFEVFTGNNFVVNTDMALAGQGICPLSDAGGMRLGDMNDLIRINSEIGGDWPETMRWGNEEMGRHKLEYVKGLRFWLTHVTNAYVPLRPLWTRS
jgi:hypothetical protein